MDVPDEALAWAAELALELRRRVKEQQARIGAAEFGNVNLSYRLGDRPERVVYCDEMVQHRLRAESQPHAAKAAEGDSDVLPQPDPEEVRSSVNAKATHYAVGDVIDGRFEVLDVLGQGGFSRVYRVRDELRGGGTSAQAIRECRRLRCGAPGDRRPSEGRSSQCRQGLLGRKAQVGDWYLITEYIDGESLDEYVSGTKRLRDREAIDVAAAHWRPTSHRE